MLVNPERNYVQFLLRSLLPAVLHIVITVSAGYAVGSEFSRRSMRAWLACAGGNPIVAIAGKFLPLFIVFSLMMMIVALIIEGWFGLEFRGDVAMMVAAAALFVVGYLALGALLQLLTRNLLMGLSLAGLIVSPAFGFAGVGFPILGMNLFSQIYGALLPLRWYESILFDQAARGLPVGASAPSFAALAGLAVCYFPLALVRLNAIRPGLSSGPSEVQPLRVEPPARGIADNAAAEWRRILANRGAFGLFVLAPVIYGVFYPQPYRSEILRDVPIAVVDGDLSGLSREIVEALDASGSVKVAVRSDTPGGSKTLFGSRQGVRYRGHSRRYAPRRAERQYRSAAGLRRRHVFVLVQIHGYRHRGCNRQRGFESRGGGRPRRRQPREGSVGVDVAGRHSVATHLQSGGRVRELHRACRIHSDHAADVAHGCRDADPARARDGRPAPRNSARPNACALDADLFRCYCST